VEWIVLNVILLQVTAKKRQHTPEAASGKRPINIGRSPGAGLFKSPGSQGSPSAKYD
jgi:hypothetical protein